MPEYTIKDIARLAGVSTGTVSRVLNGADNIAPALYERTMAVLRATNYLEAKHRVVANPRAGFGHAIKRISVIFSDMTPAWNGHPLANEYLHGIEKACREAGFRYEVFFSVPELTPEQWAATLAQTDGILIKSTHNEEDIFKILPPDFPIVGFGVYNPSMSCPQFAIDNYAVGILMTQHLLGLGHQRIAFVNHEEKHKMFTLRELGYVEAMRSAGLHDDASVIRSKTASADDRSPLRALPDMEPVLDKLLNLSPRPTAVEFVNDWAAAGFYQACRQRGISIPDTFSVCGVDNISICDIMDPPLTSFELPWSREAEFAAAALIEMINGIGRHRLNQTAIQYLGGKLVARNSVKKILSAPVPSGESVDGLLHAVIPAEK